MDSTNQMRGKLRILAGSCVRQHPDILKAHLACLKWQTGKYDIDLAFVDDNDNAESSALLKDAAKYVLPADPKPQGAEYSVTSVTHNWTEPLFHWLAREKQKLLDLAKKERYDALLLVDSDLLISPDTLDSLWNTKKDVVSGVFYTKWQPDSPPLPQVWLQHPYNLNGMGMEQHEFLGRLANRQVVRVGGLGACTLIRAAVLDRVAYWPLVEGLPQGGMWQGEDRHFCVRAQRNHVELWADAWPDIWHCYRPEDRTKLRAWQIMLEGLPDFCVESTAEGPHVGSLVSFSLEPLEEPQLAGYQEHVRGRLGAIRMLPQIDDELSTMRAGDERIIRLRFPTYYDVPNYRGQSRLVRIKLLHCKPFSEHPTLGDKPLALENAA